MIDKSSIQAMVHEILTSDNPEADTWLALCDVLEEGGVDTRSLRNRGFRLWLIPTDPREVEEVLSLAMGNLDSVLACCCRGFSTRLELEAYQHGLLERDPRPWWLAHDEREARRLLERAVAHMLADQTINEVFGEYGNLLEGTGTAGVILDG